MSVSKRNGKWVTRWREAPGGPQKMRNFTRKVDADRFDVEMHHQLQHGSYIDPSAGQITVEQYVGEWLGRRHWRPATQDRIEREVRVHILPTLGRRPLASLRRAHLEEWALSLPLAPSSVKTVFATLSSVLAAAVEDGRLPRNPAVRAKLPKVERAPVIPLEIDQVRRLAAATPEHLRAAVVLGAGTGVRQGEAMAVTVDRLLSLRREVRIDRQLWTPRHGEPVFAPPKSQRGYRTIALGGLVVEALAAHLAAFGPGPDGLLFHFGGRSISRDSLAKWIRGAATWAGLPGITWHDLRHHHASVLLSQGVSPPLVAERLGDDVTTLLRVYSHVIRSDEDRVRQLVDESMSQAGSAEGWLRDAPPSGPPETGALGGISAGQT